MNRIVSQWSLGFLDLAAFFGATTVGETVDFTREWDALPHTDQRSLMEDFRALKATGGKS